jgi:hypothetical protein
MTCLLCRLCYTLGDWWSKLIHYVPDDWERFGALMIRPYQYFMGVSVRLDDKNKCGMWGEPIPPPQGEKR